MSINDERCDELWRAVEDSMPGALSGGRPMYRALIRAGWAEHAAQEKAGHEQECGECGYTFSAEDYIGHECANEPPNHQRAEVADIPREGGGKADATSYRSTSAHHAAQPLAADDAALIAALQSAVAVAVVDTQWSREECRDFLHDRGEELRSFIAALAREQREHGQRAGSRTAPTMEDVLGSQPPLDAGQAGDPWAKWKAIVSPEQRQHELDVAIRNAATADDHIAALTRELAEAKDQWTKRTKLLAKMQQRALAAEAAISASQPVAVPRGTIKAMVDRFLAWPLPKGFAPDCGISFDGRKDDEWNNNKTWPIGTNLFTADQAREMFEYAMHDAFTASRKGTGGACPWALAEEDSDHWSTGCGNDFVLNDGTPRENYMVHCCYCGKPIEQVAPLFEDAPSPATGEK